MPGQYDLLITTQGAEDVGFVTVAEFKGRFPEFALVNNDFITVILNESIASIGTNWRDRDRKPAIMYKTAHMLAMEGYGRGKAGSTGVGNSGALKRRRVGDVETEYAGITGSGSGSSGNSYSLTHYGSEFLRLRRANFAAVGVA